jgi:hypothetical protein
MSMIKSNRKRDFKEPVAWLFGRELLSQLKWILLYTAAGSRFDPRQWMQANIYDYLKEKRADEVIEDEFWFDYLSDTGDGMKATYSIAYLCLSDLYVEDLSTDPAVQPGEVREVRLPHARGENFRNVLPRGKFLFVGGDTCYHLADYETLANRFQTPFEWAYQDLCEDLKDTPSDLNERRPLFGIPANHDYYDEIDGFRRQFRRQVSDEDLRCGVCGATGKFIRETKKDLEYECISCSPPTIIKRPQLQISAFKRCQEASYVAIKLPFGWWLWGLDTERGGIDYRQKDYFLTALKKGGEGETASNNRTHVPDKLIVANSVPIFVFGQLAKIDDEKSTRAYDELNLSLPYHNGAGDPLEAGQCRLDLSGDVHHYARYGGPHNTTDEPRAGGEAPRYSNISYASVISGLGGAFHHPSQTYAGEIKEQVLYPSENRSREAIAERIFKFKTIWKGGYVGIIGAIIAAIFYIALEVDLPIRVVDNITVFARAQRPWLFPYLQVQSLLAVSLLAFSLVGLFFGLKRVAEFLQTVRKFKTSGSRARDGVQDLKRNEDKTIRLLWVITFAITLAWLVGLYRLESYTQNMSPFFCSTVIFLCMIWAGTALWLNIKYSDLVSQMSSFRNITIYHLVLMWMLWIAIIAIISCGIFLFGGERFSVLASDLAFISTLLGFIFAILYIATGVSGEIGNKMGWPFWLLLGVLHLIFQIAIPIGLVFRGTWYVWIVAGGLVFFVFPAAGEYLMKNNISWLKIRNRWWLLIAWVVFGAGMLALTVIPGATLIDLISKYVTQYGQLSMKEDRIKDVTGLIGALFAGGITSCVWLGWYLAVSLGFNGHNNEVGGATRIENFKQLVRIRLTRDTLSAYVIAVDEPQSEGNLLKPRMIDAFTLVVKSKNNDQSPLTAGVQRAQRSRAATETATDPQ